MASIHNEQRWITDAPSLIFFWGEGTAIHRLTLDKTTLNGERGWGRGRGGEENLFYWKTHHGVRNVLNFLYFNRVSLTNIYYKMTMPRRNRKMVAVVWKEFEWKFNLPGIWKAVKPLQTNKGWEGPLNYSTWILLPAYCARHWYVGGHVPAWWWLIDDVSKSWSQGQLEDCTEADENTQKTF